MDAIALLNEDHAKAQKLTIRENIEEEVFYPALAEHPAAKAIEEEETEMFKISRQVFTTEELEELGASLEASKAEQMTEAQPERDQVEI